MKNQTQGTESAFDAYQLERERLAAVIASDGVGAGTKWAAIAMSAMSGNEDAMKEIERLIGRKPTKLTDVQVVMSAADDAQTKGERAASYDQAEQMLRAKSSAHNMANEYLSNRLGTLRRQSGMTQEALALQAGVLLSSLQKYENGKVSLLSARADTVLKIARALDVTVEDLLSE